MAKYVLLVATSASCFRNFQRGLSDFLLSGGEGQKQIQWGGYIWEEEWGLKIKFERVSNWGKITSFFELFGSIFNYKWYQRAHAKTGDETVVSQSPKEQNWRKWGKRRQKELCWQTRHLMKWKNRPILQSDDTKEWKAAKSGGEKLNYLNCHWKLINLKRSVNRSALYNKDYDGCNSKYFWPSLFKFWHFCNTLVFIIHMFNSSRV